jgi:hypothetical protein
MIPLTNHSSEVTVRSNDNPKQTSNQHNQLGLALKTTATIDHQDKSQSDSQKLYFFKSTQLASGKRR